MVILSIESVWGWSRDVGLVLVLPAGVRTGSDARSSFSDVQCRVSCESVRCHQKNLVEVVIEKEKLGRCDVSSPCYVFYLDRGI